MREKGFGEKNGKQDKREGREEKEKHEWEIDQRLAV